MLEIKILGTGCPKCRALKKVVMEAVEELGLAAAIAEEKTSRKSWNTALCLPRGSSSTKRSLWPEECPKKTRSSRSLIGLPASRGWFSSESLMGRVGGNYRFHRVENRTG